MSATSRNIFDVLYEADEPLTSRAIVDRTWERATTAAQGHALRMVVSGRESRLRSVLRRRGSTHPDGVEVCEPSLRVAWWEYVTTLLRRHRLDERLLLDEQKRYYPNPEKPPTVKRSDGTKVWYTREAWEIETPREQTIGEKHTMGMEIERLLGSLSKEELLEVLDLYVGHISGRDTKAKRPVDRRALRSRMHWLLHRPETDAGRAWLLYELARRTFGTPAEPEP